MVLVDTSVWIDHLRRGVPTLVSLLDEGLVLMHPFVLGELACGQLIDREGLLGLLRDLREAAVATDAEALGFIEQHKLMGKGLGYIDVHLLASTVLEGEARLWTRDKRLTRVSDEMGLGYRV